MPTGISRGDELLVRVAQVLTEAVPSSLIARCGGDEFGVFAIRSSREEADAGQQRLVGVALDVGAGG